MVERTLYSQDLTPLTLHDLMFQRLDVSLSQWKLKSVPPFILMPRSIKLFG